jgi:hypothetical protein
MKSLVYSSNLFTLGQLVGNSDPETTFVVQHNLRKSADAFKENYFENIIIDLQNEQKVELGVFHALYTTLKQGGRFEARFSEQSQSSITDFVTIAGFQIDTSSNSSKIIAKKPQWAGNGVATLKKNKITPNSDIKPESEQVIKVNLQEEKKAEKIVVEAQPTKASNPFAQVKVDNAELIDEDTLEENGTYQKLEKPEDCSTKPKACKDCSCGRAEQEEKE